MTLLRKAVNMGNDPKELYALLMARSLSGADLGPYIPLIGELRSTFDAIHIKSEWNTGALEDGSAEAVGPSPMWHAVKPLTCPLPLPPPAHKGLTVARSAAACV